MNTEEFLTAIRSALERCSEGRLGEAERVLDLIDWKAIGGYEPDYGALLALAREASAGIPRALEDAQALYNEIVYRRRIEVSDS